MSAFERQALGGHRRVSLKPFGQYNLLEVKLKVPWGEGRFPIERRDYIVVPKFLWIWLVVLYLVSDGFSGFGGVHLC